jgi:hypothetical protein
MEFFHQEKMIAGLRFHKRLSARREAMDGNIRGAP